MDHNHSQQNPPRQPAKGVHSCCCCCLKFACHMLRCPCKIIHTMVNHRCPARRRTKKIHKMKLVQREISEKAARNRLARMFTLNMNMMENQQNCVFCEVVEDNNWVPFLPVHSNKPQSQQQLIQMSLQQSQAQREHTIPPCQIEDNQQHENIQERHHEQKDPQIAKIQKQMPMMKVPVPQKAVLIAAEPILNNIPIILKKGKPRTMVRSNLTSSSEQSEHPHVDPAGQDKMAIKSQFHQERQQPPINSVEKLACIKPLNIASSISPSYDQFFEHLQLWGKKNSALSDKKQQRDGQLQNISLKTPKHSSPKQLDSLEQQMANQCQRYLEFDFMFEPHQKQVSSDRFQLCANPLQPLSHQQKIPLNILENGYNLLQQKPQIEQHLSIDKQHVQEPHIREPTIYQGLINKSKEEIVQNDDALQQQIQNQLLRQSQNLNEQYSRQVGEEEDQIHSENDNHQASRQDQPFSANQEEQIDQNNQFSRQQAIKQPKRQEPNQNSRFDVLFSAKDENQSHFYSLSLIKRENSNFPVQRVLQSREVSYMTQRQHEVSHHYSQPENNQQNNEMPQPLPQIHSQHQQYQYNHEELEKQKSKKSRHSHRLNQQLESEELRQQTEFNSIALNQEKLEHNSQGERVGSQIISANSQFAHSLPQLRKEHRQNLKEEEVEQSDNQRDFWQPDPEPEYSSNDKIPKPKQESIQEDQEQVKSQKYDEEMPHSLEEADDEEGNLPDESIESVERVPFEQDPQQDFEYQSQISQNLKQNDQNNSKNGSQDQQMPLRRNNLGLKEEQQNNNESEEQIQEREMEVEGGFGRKKVKSEQEEHNNSQSHSARFSSQSSRFPELSIQKMQESIVYPLSQNLGDNEQELRSSIFNQDLPLQSSNQVQDQNKAIVQPRLKITESEQNREIQPAISSAISRILVKQEAFLKRQPKIEHFHFAKIESLESKREKLELMSNFEFMIERGGLNEQQLAQLPKKTKIERINIISQFSFSNNDVICESKAEEQDKSDHLKKEEGNDFEEVEQEIIYTRKKRPKSHRRNFLSEVYPPRRQKSSGRHHRAQRQSKHRRKHYEDYYDYDELEPYDAKRGDSNSEQQRYVRQRKKSKKLQSVKKKHSRRVLEGSDSQDYNYKYE